MRTPPVRVLMALPVVAALALGVALTWLAWVAARTLGERDQAVRDGVLLRLGHALEGELREAGAADARVVMRGFLDAHADALIGVELAGPHGVLLREGDGRCRCVRAAGDARAGVARGAGSGRRRAGTRPRATGRAAPPTQRHAWQRRAARPP
ncbi:MAG: hypothetical protein AB2L07_00555 [Thermoanaerobaculaceae bacterium]